MSSELGIKSKKSDFSNWFSEVCSKADLVDLRYNVQGFVVHKPWAMRMIKHIYAIFEAELERRGHEPVLFPLVIPEENLEREKEHVAGFKPEVFWITKAGEEELPRKLALRPTSETAFYQMYSLWIRSYRDLPLKLYQSVAVYRYESHTRPFLRGREFLWIEAHDAFATHEEALRQIREDMEICEEVIWKRLGIPFRFLKRPEWDKFAGADATYAADTIMPDGKVNQISSTHDLGQRFAKAFNITYVDESGKENYVWQTCFGPGIWRIVAALIAIHGDDKGLVLPFEIAPIQVVIVPIFYSEEERKEVVDFCKEVEQMLKANAIRCKVDLRDETPGFKFNDWELRGVPLRIEIGPRELKERYVMLVRRDSGERIESKLDGLVAEIKKLGEEILENLKRRAVESFEQRIAKAEDREEVAKALNGGKVVYMPFCGREECARELQEVTGGGKVRGTELEPKKASGRCAWCGEKAKEWVYVAKAY